MVNCVATHDEFPIEAGAFTRYRDDTLLRDCGTLFERWMEAVPESERAPVTVEELILEAQVLLMCEEIQDSRRVERRLERCITDIATNRQSEILDVVRTRLFAREDYFARLRKVDHLSRQLIRAELDRTITRPAKVS